MAQELEHASVLKPHPTVDMSTTILINAPRINGNTRPGLVAVASRKPIQMGTDFPIA
jgi:hypothetical protein